MKRLPFLLGSLVLLCVLLAQWIAPDRTTTKAAGMNSSIIEPVKVTPLTLQTGERQKIWKSSENDIWVNQPVVQVENTSDKAIEFMTVEISFAGAKFSGEIFHLGYGQVPGQNQISKQVGTLQPGAKVNLSMSKNADSGAGSRLLASGAHPPSGSRATARIGIVIFADGTAWLDGMLHVPDPRNRLRWIVVETPKINALLSPASLVEMAKVEYRVAPAAAPMQQCYRYDGFEILECCTSLVQYNHLLSPAPFGNWEPITMHYDCPDGTICEWTKRVICGQGG